ncbi:hypothetical protein JMM80_20195 [Serratia marcescens]|nr:hypothetical protein JMM80_20195 [Serratia marcescens]
MNITEKAQWEESVTLLTRQQKVEGGQDGAANIQAKELANRTAWLKSQVESIPDYREYTFYTSDDDPDGTITGLAGTPVGKIFRVALYDGQGQSVAFRYYLNNNGAASFLNEIPSSRAIGDLTSVDSMLLTGLSQLVVSVVRVTEDLDAMKISDASQTLNNANLLEAVSVQSKALAAISPTVEGNTENLSVKSASLNSCA